MNNKNIYRDTSSSKEENVPKNKGTLSPLKSEMSRILIIEPNWLGDTLFTTPAIRAIRYEYQNAYIAVLAHKRCLSIVENNPNINEVIKIGETRGLPGFFKKLNLLPLLKSKNFDVVFLFSRSMSHALICAFCNIPERIGYTRTKLSFLLTNKIIPSKEDTHRVEYYLNIAKSANIHTDNKDYDFYIKQEYQDKAEAILNKAGISRNQAYFVINPGGNWLPKRWQKEKFAKLADAILNKYKTKVVITGAKKDIALGEDIRKLSKSKPINLCGNTTIKQLGALLKNAKAVISNDSGPMHIAVSQRTPTIALFGPTKPSITGPYGSSKYIVVKKDIDCTVPCYNKSCADYKCMEVITVSDVMDALEKLLQ